MNFPEISLLKQEKTNAISKCNAKLARLIDNELQKAKILKQSVNSDAKLIINKAKFEIIKEKLKAAVTDLQSNVLKQETQIRKRFKIKITNLQDNQYKEMENLSETFIKEIQTETERPCVAAANLVISAKKVAKMGEFERAENLYEESKTTAERYYDDVVMAISTRYANDMTEMGKRHTQQIENMIDKMNEAIDAIYRQFDEDIQLKEKILLNASRRLGIEEEIDLKPKLVNRFTLNTPASLRYHYSNSYLNDSPVSQKNRISFSDTESDTDQT